MLKVPKPSGVGISLDVTLPTFILLVMLVLIVVLSQQLLVEPDILLVGLYWKLCYYFIECDGLCFYLLNSE